MPTTPEQSEAYRQAFIDFFVESDDPEEPSLPTSYIPGSDQKILMMQKRAMAGYSVFSVGDAEMPPNCGWSIVIGKNGRIISKELVKNQIRMQEVVVVEDNLLEGWINGKAEKASSDDATGEHQSGVRNANAGRSRRGSRQRAG